MFSNNIETNNKKVCLVNRDNNYNLAVELLEAGVTIDSSDTHEKTSVIIAMCKIQRDIVKELMKHGVTHGSCQNQRSQDHELMRQKLAKLAAIRDKIQEDPSIIATIKTESQHKN
jgi:predicted lactoylglutathione lyase